MKKEILNDRELVEEINCICTMIDYLPPEEQDTAINAVLFLDTVDLEVADDDTLEAYKLCRSMVKKYAKMVEERLDQEEQDFFGVCE